MFNDDIGQNYNPKPGKTLKEVDKKETGFFTDFEAHGSYYCFYIRIV